MYRQPYSVLRPAACCVIAGLLVLGCGAGKPTGAGSPAGSPGGGAPGGMVGGPPGAGMPVAVIARRVEPRTFVDRFTALGTARANESIDVTA
ncbi:MAG: hypothetical protein ABI661_09935, partial [Gammaproteobacteria bacterium]